MQQISPHLVLLELAYKESNNQFVSSTLLQEYLNLAEVDSKNRNSWYKKAINVAKKHLKEFPHDRSKHLVVVDLGFAYFCIGKSRLALDNFKKALKTLPKSEQELKKSLLLNISKIEKTYKV